MGFSLGGFGLGTLIGGPVGGLIGGVGGAGGIRGILGGNTSQATTSTNNYNQNSTTNQDQTQNATQTQFQDTLSRLLNLSRNTQQQAQTGATTQTTAPWNPQQNYILQAFMDAQKLLQNPGSTVAGFTPTQVQAQGVARSTAEQLIPQLINPATDAFTSALSAPDINNNPAIPGLINAAIRPIREQLTEQVLPSINNEFINSGTFGGSRQDIAKGLALRGAENAAGDATASIVNNAYNTGLATRNQALGLTPQLISVATSPADILGTVGSQEQQLEQARLNEPGNRLADFFKIVSPTFGGTTTGTTESTGELTGTQQTQQTQEQQQQSIMDELRKILGSTTTSTSGSSAGTGTGSAQGDPLQGLLGIGALAGAFLSDRRLKSFVSRVGTHRRGIGLYLYKIFNKWTLGVMADEVLKVAPEAIGYNSGYMTVNYSML